MLRRMVDWIFGYDFFLSYAWKDGRTYAVALAEQLRSDGFEVFLDSESYNTGDHWRPVGRRALARTSQLVLIGTPGALQSGPVREELLAFGPTGRKIVPIAFDGSLRSLDDELRRVVPEDALYIDEPESTLRDGPSPHVVEQLRRGFGAERQNRRRVRFLSWALLFASVLAVTATGAAIAARLAQLDSQSRAWAAQAEVELDRSPALAMLLAAEADDRWGTEQSRASLYTTIARYPIERYLQAPAPIGSVASTSHALWAGDWDGTVWREVGHALEPLVALGRPITAMDVTAAGDRLAVATDDGV
ncbi:MAG: toll/interleukin-1 receptor domain-containing protein, partial [Myxococcota bacterium]